VYSDIPEIHDAITKVPGSLQRTLAAIPLCSKLDCRSSWPAR